MEFEYLDWEQVQDLSFNLASTIQASKKKTDCIVAISRGGLIVARILSDFLALPIFNISIDSYLDIGQNKQPRLTQGINFSLEKKNVLLVDEICDSGKTFFFGKQYLGFFQPAKIATATLILKTHSEFKPDFHAAIIDKWVIFPYEQRETYEELKNSFSDEKLVKIGLRAKYFALFKQLNK